MTAFRDAYKERAQNGFDDDPFEGTSSPSSYPPLPPAGGAGRSKRRPYRRGTTANTIWTRCGCWPRPATCTFWPRPTTLWC